MNILITGGAGYIGSHTIVELLRDNHSIVVVDNLVNSSQESIQRVEKITDKKIIFYPVDVCERAQLFKVFENHNFDAVMHFAGLKAVGESVADPLRYYQNNIDSTFVLLDLMNKFNVKKFIFSSSATVYGNPSELPLREETSIGIGITNPYGRTKYMIEEILRDIAVADNSWNIALLRYFNPVGAHKSGLIGEDPSGIPNNLLPYISQVAVGKLQKLKIFGDDYNTPDGTGVRDYIHVVDLAKGHVAALNNLTQGAHTYNLGTGKGVSVLELIHVFEEVSGKSIPYEVTPRLQGDVASCYASPSRANTELGWKAEKSIKEACEDAWRWQSKNPSGYKDSNN